MNSLLDFVWTTVGNSASFPAPWLYRILYDVPISRFDQIVGTYLLEQNYRKQAAKQHQFDFNRPLDSSLLLEYTLIKNKNSLSVGSDNGTFSILLPLWFQSSPVCLSVELEKVVGLIDFYSLRWNSEMMSSSLAILNSTRLDIQIPPEKIQWGVNKLTISAWSDFGVKKLKISTDPKSDKGD